MSHQATAWITSFASRHREHRPFARAKSRVSCSVPVMAATACRFGISASTARQSSQRARDGSARSFATTFLGLLSTERLGAEECS